MSEGVRWGSMTVRTTCTKCGQPLPLTWITETAACPYCFSEEAIPKKVWIDLVRELDPLTEGGRAVEGTVLLGARQVVYALATGKPKCEKCAAPLPVEALVPGASRNFACTSCGDPASTAPVPAWVRKSVGPARQLVALDPRDELDGHHALRAAEEPKPIVMSCPRCGGGLEITVKSERILACRFCSAEVYLPDEIWRRLHPVRTVSPVYVAFEGKSLRTRQREGDARAAEVRQREAEEQRRRAAADAMVEAEERGRAAGNAKVVGYLASALLLCALFSSTLVGVAFAPRGGPPDGLVIAGAIVLAIGLIVTVALVTRPLALATQRPFEWLLFETWFWIPFAVLMPGVGQIMALIRAVLLARGRFGSSRIESGGSSTHYAAIAVRNGEGRPAALMFLGLAVLWPTTLATVLAPAEIAALLSALGIGG